MFSPVDPEELPLLEAVLADPDDVVMRLVYADWLEERGDLRAEWLRLEAEFRRVNNMHHRYRPVRKRLRALLPRIPRDWAYEVTRRPFRIARAQQWGITPNDPRYRDFSESTFRWLSHGGG